MTKMKTLLIACSVGLTLLAVTELLEARGRGGGFRGGGMRGGGGMSRGGMSRGGFSRPSYGGGARPSYRAPTVRTPSVNRSPSFSRPSQPAYRHSQRPGGGGSIGSRGPGSVQFPRSGSAGSRLGDRQIGSVDRTPANRVGDRQIGRTDRTPANRVGDRQVGPTDRTPRDLAGRAAIPGLSRRCGFDSRIQTER